MNDALFAAAARPARIVILGLPMKPYGIGHEILLLNQGNPLLSGSFDSLDKTAQRQSVIRAADICSQTWGESGFIPVTFRDTWKWKRVWSKWEKFTKKLTDSDWITAVADFRNYRQAGSAFPNIPDEEADMICNGESKKGREYGSPYLARLYNFVCGLPYREHGQTAFDFPFALANFLYLTKLEQDGDLKIENRKELEEKENIAKIRAEVAKEKEDACPR